MSLCMEKKLKRNTPSVHTGELLGVMTRDFVCVCVYTFSLYSKFCQWPYVTFVIKESEKILLLK